MTLPSNPRCAMCGRLADYTVTIVLSSRGRRPHRKAGSKSVALCMDCKRVWEQISWPPMRKAIEAATVKLELRLKTETDNGQSEFVL